MPRQSHLPTEEQLRQLYSDAIKNPGRTCELPFGENFLLSVSRPKGTGGCDWTLYRWVGTTSTPEWVYDSNDPRWVARQIVEYFPRWSPHRRVVQDPADSIKNGSWFSMTSGLASEEPEVQGQARPAMEGDLKHVGLPNLLRSLAKDRLTGRLELWAGSEFATIYITGGALMHAIMGEEQGEPVLLQVLTWTDGRFQFHFDSSNSRQSIHKRLDLLLLEVADAKERLRMAAEPAERVVPGYSTFVPAPKALAEVAVESDQSMSQSQPKIVPPVRQPSPTGQHSLPHEEAEPPKSVLAKVENTSDVHRFLTNPETGLFTNPVLMYFLELEFVRCQRYSRCFSLLLVDIGVKSDGAAAATDSKDTRGLQTLSASADKELSQLIRSVKRGPDLLAHYKGPGTFAMLLPETDTNLGRNLTFRLAEFLRSIPPNDWTGGKPLAFSIGMAGAPQDSQTSDGLIEMAVASKLTFGL